MNAAVEGLRAQPENERLAEVKKPSREEAEAAVRTLIAWAGDNPDREGLIDTPGRVTRAYEEFFEGYQADPFKELSRTFEEVEGYQDMVMLRDINIESHCEHHMVPILGRAHIAYVPTKKVVGISKLARVIEIYGKRLQTQETMTAQIAGTINAALQPQGVAILIEAKHQCMTTRGIKKPDVATITTQFTGVFRDDPRMEARFMQMIRGY
ncbi:GTP cyclohydrolase I FolE [Parvibaculum sp.]|uniref:GTP cyclohydrolase I FolE n=1 Tax=Parvibaculum sp. TaxID=2024848 RepID=UPI0025E8A3E2|nr:GTP cyclohydrolase I FolE [Parvibaculum sp.]